MTSLKLAWIVFLKELVDALRDRRTLFAVLLSSVAIGPALLVLGSSLMSDLEKRAEAREIYASGLENAPTLRNFIERNTFVIKQAPADFERQLIDKTLGDPVLVVPPDFERRLADAETPTVEIVSSQSNQRAEGGVSRLVRVLRGFDGEQASLRLATRGVAAGLTQSIRIYNRDLANPATRAGTLMGFLPVFVLMAVLYGAMAAALDTTAGERERGSLEPLLMNPMPRAALVIGKWGAVASVSMLIAALSCLSFLPGQWLLRSEALAALFQFGWFEAAMFMALLLPLSAALAAVMMAIAIRCKTFKEAQANMTVLLLVVSLLPMVTILNPGAEKAWQVWLPPLAQTTLMNRVLKGEALATLDVLIPVVVCAVLTVACLAWVSRRLATAAMR